MAGKEQQPIPLNVENPLEALKFIQLSVESDNFRGTGKQFVLLQKCIKIVFNTLAQNLLKDEQAKGKQLGNTKDLGESVQDIESK